MDLRGIMCGEWQKKPRISKVHIPYNSIHITFLKWQTYRMNRLMVAMDKMGCGVCMTIYGWHKKFLCADGIVLYLDGGIEYVNLYLCWNYVDLYTHECM